MTPEKVSQFRDEFKDYGTQLLVFYQEMVNVGIAEEQAVVLMQEFHKHLLQEHRAIKEREWKEATTWGEKPSGTATH